MRRSTRDQAMRYAVNGNTRDASMIGWIVLATTIVGRLSCGVANGAESRNFEAPGQVTYFDAARLQPLCGKALEVNRLAWEIPQGWSKSRADLTRLLAPFHPLSLKPRVVLCAYQFREGENGIGAVWALPEGAESPEPQDCPLSRSGEPWNIDVPRPPAAYVSIMSHIKGDGSPWSYLAASILSREIAEFGARWHGRQWSVHRVVGANPLTTPGDHDADPLAAPRGAASEWQWLEPEPCRWEPHVRMEPEGVTVTFYTYSGWQRQHLYRHTDRYRPGSYEGRSERTEIAVGPGGFLF